jgi:hypothetical protein
MSSQESVTQEQIQEMRKLALFSKRLSEWHIKNLKLWPQIALEGLQKAEVEYSIGDRPDECYINYVIKVNDGTDMSDFALRASHIEKWVKSLLWNDINFSMKDFDGKVLYGSLMEELK